MTAKTIDTVLVSIWLAIWAPFLFWPRTGRFSGCLSRRTWNFPYWILPLLWGGSLIDLFGSHANWFSLSFRIGRDSWGFVGLDAFVIVLTGLDWWTENDRPKRWKKKVAELGGKFQLKPMPEPVINV